MEALLKLAADAGPPVSSHYGQRGQQGIGAATLENQASAMAGALVNYGENHRNMKQVHRFGHSRHTWHRSGPTMSGVMIIFDQTADNRRLKWLPICDGYTRELVALEVERRMEAQDAILILEAAVEARGGPRNSSAATTGLSRGEAETAGGNLSPRPSRTNRSIQDQGMAAEL